MKVKQRRSSQRVRSRQNKKITIKYVIQVSILMQNLIGVERKKYIINWKTKLEPLQEIQNYIIINIIFKLGIIYKIILVQIILCIQFLMYIQQRRLRHKKPINSYAGQANNDANDAKDEDFMRNYNSSKKLRNGKQKATTEQNKKLAQILCEFVTLANSNYRNYLNKNQQPQQQTPQKEVKGSKKIICKTEMDQQIDKGKFEEIVLKQQQKNQRAQKNINKSLLTKKIKKEKSSRAELAKSKEIRQQVNVSLSESQPLNIIQTQKKSIEQNCEKQKPKEAFIPSSQNSNPKSNLSSTQQMQPMQHLQQFQQQMTQNPLFALNPVLYSLYYPYPQMNSYQISLEHLKANPYMMQSYMNLMSPNYIQFSKLALNKNIPVQPKKEQIEKPKLQLNTIKQQVEKPKQGRKLSQQKTQVPLKISQPIDFKNKSCHHVAIAYNIHFSKLKQKGLLQNMNNSKEYQKLDPTFLAKKIREKKLSEHITSIQQNSTYN